MPPLLESAGSALGALPRLDLLAVTHVKPQPTNSCLQSNPEMARQAASAMAAMSDDQLASMLAQSGMPGVTPEMAKQAASMMRSMPPDQLAAMAQAQAAAGFPGAPAAGVPAAPAAAAPAAPVAPAATATAGVVPAAAAGGSPDQMAEAMKQNPEMLKQVRGSANVVCGLLYVLAMRNRVCGLCMLLLSRRLLHGADPWSHLTCMPPTCVNHPSEHHFTLHPTMQAATMMENMSEEQLRSMASMMPGGAAVSGANGWGDEWRSLGCGKARSLGLGFSMQRSWADAAFAF